MNGMHEFTSVERPVTHYAFLETRGLYSEVAQKLWGDLGPLLSEIGHDSIREYLGLSGMDTSKTGNDALIYQAGIALAAAPQKLPSKMQYRAVASGKYARFLHIGPYKEIGAVFDHAFKLLAESKTNLRSEFCIENYLNDPQTTPEKELKTEILIPVV